MTSKVARLFPFQVLLDPTSSGLGFASKVQAEQIRSVTVERVGHSVGTVPHGLMRDIEASLALHLGV